MQENCLPIMERQGAYIKIVLNQRREPTLIVAYKHSFWGFDSIQGEADFAAVTPCASSPYLKQKYEKSAFHNIK